MPTRKAKESPHGAAAGKAVPVAQRRAQAAPESEFRETTDGERIPVTALTGGGNKYHAVKTWSELCQRTFDSKGEAEYGEMLFMRQQAGEIRRLEFQKRYVLSLQPRVAYTADFAYWEHGKLIVADFKGHDTDASRVRRAWLFQRYGILVEVVKRGDA